MRRIRMWLARRRALKIEALDTLESKATIKGQRSLEALAVAYGWPAQWNVCQFCGTWSWAHPPHEGNPCPLPTTIADAAGLNLEANAAMTRRAGVQTEQVTRLITEHFLEEGDD